MKDIEWIISEGEGRPTCAQSSSPHLALFAVDGIQEKEYWVVMTLICHDKGELDLEKQGLIWTYDELLKQYCKWEMQKWFN